MASRIVDIFSYANFIVCRGHTRSALKSSELIVDTRHRGILSFASNRMNLPARKTDIAIYTGIRPREIRGEGSKEAHRCRANPAYPL